MLCTFQGRRTRGTWGVKLSEDAPFFLNMVLLALSKISWKFHLKFQRYIPDWGAHPIFRWLRRPCLYFLFGKFTGTSLWSSLLPKLPVLPFSSKQRTRREGSIHKLWNDEVIYFFACRSLEKLNSKHDLLVTVGHCLASREEWTQCRRW